MNHGKVAYDIQSSQMQTMFVDMTMHENPGPFIIYFQMDYDMS